MQERQEQELACRARRGDQEALEELIALLYPAVFAYFYKNTGSYHGSKDLTQEVFIRMAASIARYRPIKPFKSWLFAIASNQLKNHWRTLARRREGPLPCPEPAGRDPALAGIEEQAMLEAALGRLPPEQKEALILRFYCGFALREIAGITGAAESTVKARIRYGLEKLRKELTCDEPCKP